MEFSFDINNLFGPDVARLNAKLTPYRSCPGSRQYDKQMKQVIDEMGEASAKAQGLRSAITSSDRMRHTDQILYVVKESDGNRNLGCVVGILKMGKKKLFVYDNHGVQHEMEPLCVLDFYVHESRQRRGYGRKLFDFMLQDEVVKPQHLAIDKPSHKFSQFLQKHYHLKAIIPQVNNFVIFTGFFTDRHKQISRVAGSERKAPLFLYESPRENKHALQGISVQQQKEALQHVTPRQTSIGDTAEARPGSAKSNSSGEFANNRLPGMQTLYSRYSLNTTSPLPNIGQSKNSSADSLYGRKVPSPPALNNPSAYQDRRGHLKISNPVTTNSLNNKLSSVILNSNNQDSNSHRQHHSNQPSNQSQSVTQTNNAYMFSNGHPGNNTAGNMSNSRSSYDRQPQLEKSGEKSLIPTQQSSSDLLQNQSDSSDVLLPKNFIPYANLKLPEADPYSRRTLSTRTTDTQWNVFGMPKTQSPTGYANPQRFQNTRPW